MALLIALTNVPELADYPPSIRQMLVRHAQALLRFDCRFAGWLQVVLSVGGGLLGVAAGLCVEVLCFPGRSVTDALPVAMVCNLLGAAVGGFSGGFIGLQFQARKLRPYLRRAIEEYGCHANPRL